MLRLGRRNFVTRAAKALGGSWIWPRLELTSGYEADFQFHPHYREPTTLDAALIQIKAGHDEFVSERHHDSIAQRLEAWRSNVKNIQALEKIFGPGFVGTSWRPLETKTLRPRSVGLDVHQLAFAPHPALTRAEFLGELEMSLRVYPRVLVAELQIVGIETHSNRIGTRIRYELVGTGKDFYREQRVGEWSLDWEVGTEDLYSLVGWRMHDEVRSRSTEACYADVTKSAFGANSSYGAQMMHGADYWRTVLDGASGIDIYGHNGVSVGDIYGDGHDDIYVCQPAGLPNRLYRNRGNGTFEDITESAGVGVLENTACALFADFDNDGRQDLLVVRANGPLLFMNVGGGKFRLKNDAFHFANPPQGTFTGAAAADYNRDGLLDIYFCLYTYYQGADQYKYPTPYFAAENGPPNFLMRNNGDGSFRDATTESGLDKNNSRYSFCCAWSDFNGDGWPDLYVVNDFGRKNLYQNNGDGTFDDVAREKGVEDVGAGMSVAWFDRDLYVANMWTAAGERISSDKAFQKDAGAEIQAFYRKHAMGNSLFREENDGKFRDVTAESGLAVGRWSWSSDSLDFDHDGSPDIYIANGMVSGALREDLNSFFWRQVVAKSPNTAKPAADYEQGWKSINELIRSDYSWSGFERNLFYANNGDGTFSDVSGVVGLDFVEDCRSFALADFDGDGRQEVLVKNRNAPQLRLMKNIISDLPPAIAFRLRGTKSNLDAIGATVSIGPQNKTVQAGSGFLSQHSKELFFGLGAATGNVTATIRWPSGLTQQLKDLEPGHRVWVTEGVESIRVEPFKAGETQASAAQAVESYPDLIETWLLAPVNAPLASGSLITFDRTTDASDERAAIYNLLFRTLFDRHRDMPLPTSFLIDEDGQIVKVYQGAVNLLTVKKDLANVPRTNSERLAKALPFPGFSHTFEFGRNYLSLGSIFFQRGYVEAAGDFFQSALKDDPASAEALYGLGSVYLKQQKNNPAQDCFEKAAKAKASYPETVPNAWNNLGLLAARQGDAVKAAGYFEQALAIDPDHFIALENLGSAYRQQKRLPEARAILERALAIKPDDAEANYSLGMVFAQTNDTPQAFEHLRKALEARPVYPEALNNLGVLYLRTRRRDEAVARFEECMRVAPAFDQSYLNLARVYAIEGNKEKARAVLTALLAQHPDHAGARQALEQLH
jgi:tetratricopeptide (TPR) repeat protein